MSDSVGFEPAQRAVFEESGLEPESHFVEIEGLDTTVHVIDSGNQTDPEVPLLFVHGGGTFGAVFAPLMAQLDGVRTLAIDRPGFGLSDAFRYGRRTLPETACQVLTGVLDELGLAQVDIAGNSMGGYWGVRFALNRPERVRRLILLGSVPTFPGTRPPIPLRLYVLPVVNRRLGGLFLATDESAAIDKFEIFGEGETIQQYPAITRAVVARDRSPGAHDLDISEMDALLTLRGWRSMNQLTIGDVRALTTPTLAIWGADDPLGGPEAVKRPFDEIPDGTLAALEAGHLPWFGYPSRCATLIRRFRSEHA